MQNPYGLCLLAFWANAGLSSPSFFFFFFTASVFADWVNYLPVAHCTHQNISSLYLLKMVAALCSQQVCLSAGEFLDNVERWRQ